MAYQIDFTAQNYVNRSRRKIVLRLLLLAAIVGTVWGVYDVYTTYNQPTLNMKLAEYEAVTRPIEEVNAAWEVAAKEYDVIIRYYRLIWAANPTNFLETMASSAAPRFGRGAKPLSWMLKTGGECRLDYRYVFNPGDKAEQTKGLETNVVNAVTSIVEVAGGKVDVQGVLHENLLNVEELNITVKFALPNVMPFPVKDRGLADCVNEIVAMRKKVQESKIAKGGGAKGAPSTAQTIMMAYLPIGKDKPEFPVWADVLNVSGWFGRADRFIAKNRIPGDDAERRRLKEAWNKVGEARFPWDRFRTLDNDELVNRTKVLGTVSDGVKRFKGFLEQRRADCRKKTEPFIEAYDHNKVFNEPLIESDLKDRFAKAAGIARARAVFKDEPGVEPAVLETDDEKFAFTWVRWTLSIGDSVGGERGVGNGEQGAGNEEPLSLERLADCVRRVLKQPGPGYVLDTLKVDFGEGGIVTGAILEGLLPVKKVESKKEATANVN